MKPLFLKITTLTVIVLSLAMPLNKVWADDDSCKISDQQYGIIQKIQHALDVRRTVTNMFSSLVSDATLTTTVHADPDQLARCVKYASKNGIEFPSDVLDSLSSCEEKSDDKANCDSLFNTYTQPQVTGSTYIFPYKNNITNASLLGIAYSLERGLKEPLPVNLAFFVQDEIKNIPFLNKAFAQKYKGPILSNTGLEGMVLSLWKVFRNIAYGLISLFLIIIGIMMIMRKKVDQQTVVNIQYALPKIIMVLILIPFSYPIAATIASFGWAAQDTAKALVSAAITNASWSANSISWATSAGFVVTIIFSVLFSLGGSVILVVVVAFLALVIICLYAWLLIKIYITYFKLIAGLIICPMVFAIGIIPGNESKITDWFKMTLAQALSLPAMAAVSTIGFFLTSALFRSSPFPSTTPILAILVGPSLVILSLYYASKMPEKVEAAIVGEPKKRR